MYPRVRQYESSELHRYLALKDLERAERAREKPRRRRVRRLGLAVFGRRLAGSFHR